METEEQNEDFQRLHHLITGTDDVKGFLTGMSKYAAATLTRAAGSRIECAVTLHRRRRRATVAGSSDIAILLDGVEQALGDGPCLEALQTLQPVLLADTATSDRWPAYAKNLAAAGARSVLGVPLELGEDASAALNFFAADTGLFTRDVIDEAAVFADMAGQALRLTVRIATADLLAADLKAAMESRTASTWPPASSWRRTAAARTKPSRNCKKHQQTATRNSGTSPKTSSAPGPRPATPQPPPTSTNKLPGARSGTSRHPRCIPCNPAMIQWSVSGLTGCTVNV